MGGYWRLPDKLSNVTYKGFNLFIDEDDAGDQYTFCPPLEQVVVTNKSVMRMFGLRKVKHIRV